MRIHVKPLQETRVDLLLLIKNINLAFSLDCLPRKLGDGWHLLTLGATSLVGGLCSGVSVFYFSPLFLDLGCKYAATESLDKKNLSTFIVISNSSILLIFLGFGPGFPFSAWNPKSGHSYTCFSGEGC